MDQIETVTSIGTGLRNLLAKVRWNDLTKRRRTTVSTLAQITAGGLFCFVYYLVRGRYETSLPFGGVTLVLASATVATYLVCLALHRKAHLLTYGTAAVGSTCAFLIVILAARSTTDALTAAGLVPPLVGSWIAVRWVSLLTSRGLTGADFAEATTTIRGTATIWIGFLLLAASQVCMSAAGLGVAIAEGLAGGLSGFISLAAIFTYAGPGWSEYQRGRARCDVNVISQGAS